MSTRTTEPNTITQGERLAWTRGFAGYSSDDYTLIYRFRGPGPGINVEATAGTGGGFDAEITAAQSLTLSVGEYEWQAWLTETADATNTFPVEEGIIAVLRGFAADATVTHDLRSPAKIMLDTIDAAMLAFATSDVVEYEIETPAGRRRVKRSDKATLTAERKYWAGIVTNEYARENARRGRPLMTSIKMRVYDE